MKPKSMHTLCRQRTLLQIVLALRKSAHVTENVKNASSIIQRKTKIPTVQDNRLKNHVFVIINPFLILVHDFRKRIIISCFISENSPKRRHTLGKLDELLMMVKTRNWGKYSKTSVVVARGRFELPSKAPKASMIAATPPG
jgi:hypothetical protein